MRSGLSAYGTLYGSPSIADAVLLHDDSDALVTETVSAGQYGPLTIKTHASHVESIYLHLTHSFLL